MDDPNYHKLGICCMLENKRGANPMWELGSWFSKEWNPILWLIELKKKLDVEL